MTSNIKHKPFYIATLRNGRRTWFFVEAGENVEELAKENGHYGTQEIEGPFATRYECYDKGAT